MGKIWCRALEKRRVGSFLMIVLLFVIATAFVCPFTAAATILNPPYDDNITQPDDYEGDYGDDTFSRAYVIAIDDVFQRHNFHDRGDTDWGKFYGLSGQTYTILATNQGSLSDPVIHLYDEDGVTLLMSSESGVTGSTGRALVISRASDMGEVEMSFSPAKNGVYPIRVSNGDPDVYGAGTDYDLKVRTSAGSSITSTVEGIVIDTLSSNAVADVRIRTNAQRSALSLPTGDYLMPHPAGTFTLTAEASGYKPFSETVSLDESETLIKHIALAPLSAACTKGGTQAGSLVTETISVDECRILDLRLIQRPPVTTSGRLYVSLRVPSVPEWIDLMWFRPSDDKVPLPLYVKLVKIGDRYIPDALNYDYFRGSLGGPDLQFDVGTSGLEGQTIVFETWYLADGADFNVANLKRIQAVEVRFE